MKTSVSVICYKYKILANGEYPIMLRVAKDGKRTMKSLGVSVNPIYWDFNKNEPKSNCPNKDLINKIILQTKLEYQSKILEKKANDEEFTATSLINEEKQEIKAKSVEEFYLSLIEDLKNKGQVGTSYAYLNSYRVLKHFNKRKKLNFTFSHIDVSFCKKFEEWLRSKGNKDTTISYQLRTLRATFNRAIEAKIVAKDKNPFTEYKLSHLNSDVIGFTRSLEPLTKGKHTKALILGTGGVSKAVVYSLTQMGIEYIFVSRKRKGHCIRTTYRGDYAYPHTHNKLHTAWNGGARHRPMPHNPLRATECKPPTVRHSL